MSSNTHNPDKDQERVCVAAFSSAHGVSGALRLKSFTENPDDVAEFSILQSEDASKTYDVEVVSHTGKGELIVKVAGVDGRDAAELLKGERLYVSRKELPDAGDEEFYHADLIGLTVKTSSGKSLGTVRAVFDFGAGDMLEILPKEGALIMVPFTKAIVPIVDIEKGRVIVDPPEGLLPEEKKKKKKRKKVKKDTAKEGDQ
ncbi:Ribosome maturation factor RimM [Candidatus Terasakiella magnetica]|uniref:Ribosome maturation factor RimM n=1 Tax=Candidatus Terasakiella magnetica TaxID=1867952 RepID=A0A1C3RIU1_9PROT|nr:ribosome maturation factor RimM [Candidatus Terasakiella magnetica]SCA57183.1 Ribosome maturation factor RimM [Candidatus Terasakiella magnetica]